MLNDPRKDTDGLTDSERAYRLIRDDVVAGDLKAGAKLKVVDLKSRYEIGAAPLREALARLAGDKLVSQRSNHGYYVRDVSTQDVIDLSRMRILLECEGIRDSLKNGDDEWESNLVAAYHRLSLAEKRIAEGDTSADIEARNADFHDALINGTDSFWLFDLRAQVYAHHERYRVLSRSVTAGKRDTAVEHAAIYKAAVERDIPRTCELITKHIDLTTQHAIHVMSRD